MNQWNVNRTALKYKFINSFFYRNNFFINSKKYNSTVLFKLKLWFTFKNHYSLFLRKFIFKYVRLGTLSSHFVRAILYKNLTYQTRSKYRPKLFSTHAFSEWVYNVVLYNNTYFSTIMYLLYSASLNPAQLSSYHDANFNICSNPTINIYNHQIKAPLQYRIVTGPISINHSTKDLLLLLQFIEVVEQFLTEADPNKRIVLQNRVLEQLSNHQSLMLSRFFIFICVNENIYFIDTFLLFFSIIF